MQAVAIICLVEKRYKERATLSLNLLRWCAFAAFVGGALFFGKILWGMMNVVPAYAPDFTDTLFFLVPLLWLIGLAGFHIRYAGRYGTLEEIGFLIAFGGVAVGVVGSLGGIWIETLRLAYWLGFRFLCIGLVLLGVASIRARVLPRGLSALILILGLLGLGRALFMFFAATMGAMGIEAPETPGTFLSLWAGTLTSLLGLLFGLGWVWLGLVLWADKSEAA